MRGYNVVLFVTTGQDRIRVLLKHHDTLGDAQEHLLWQWKHQRRTDYQYTIQAA